MTINPLSGIPDFPQTIPTNTVLGRTGIDAGPVQALPFSAIQTNVSTGVVHYVSNTGNDNNSGTSIAQPWATIARVNVSGFQPGDSVLFQGGQTFSGAIVSPSSGTASSPITFGSYGGGQATISSGTADGFSSTNQSGIIVRDLIFTGSSGSNRGIHFINSGSARLKNVQAISCVVSGYGFDGILFFGSAGVGYDQILIDGCTASGCTGHAGAGVAGTTVCGIQVAGTVATANANVLVRNCVAHDNAGCTDVTLTGNGIIVEETQVGLIHNCVAYNNGAAANCTGGGGPTGIWCNDCAYVTIDTCTSYNNTTANSQDGEGFDIDVFSSYCTIRNCLSFGNAGPGFAMFGNITGGPATDHCSIIDCTSINDCTLPSLTGSITLSCANASALTNAVVSGNKVYQSNAGTDALFIRGGSANTATGTITGNVFAISAAQNFINNALNSANLLFTNNDYRSAGAVSIKWNGITYTSVVAFAIATGQEAAGKIADMASGSSFAIVGANPLLNFHNTQSGGKEFQFGNGLNTTTPIFGLSLNASPNFPDVWSVNWDNLLSFQLTSGAVYGWTASATTSFANMDTGFSRIAPVSSVPTVAIGNGTPADASGTIKAKTKAGAPVAADVPAGTWVLIRDTTNNTTKLYYNNAGTLQAVALV